MNIYGKIVKLRALEMDDMEILRNIINDPEIEGLVEGWSFPVSKKEQEDWYNTIYRDKKNLRFAIETKKGEMIGMAILRDIDWKNKTAFSGIKIGNKDYRNKGYGTDVIMAIMRYVFCELGLNKLEANILDNNIPSQKLHIDRCGWTIEGRKRQHIFKRNKFHDQLIIGILKDEYDKLITKTKYWNEK
ncbi:MAG: GNAT family N-acetyltransferase [Tissierellaceae bacterium]|nr:GNAT family N-acetyltransferase [Tissierellaceae bacterium]